MLKSLEVVQNEFELALLENPVIIFSKNLLILLRRKKKQNILSYYEYEIVFF